MQVATMGAGHAGPVSAACFPTFGFTVTCVDTATAASP